MVLLKVILAVCGNITGSGFLAVPLVALLLDDADTACGLVAFMNGKVERNDLGTVELGEGIDRPAIVCIIQIHIGDIDHPGQVIFFAEFPCALRTDFDTGLTGDNDDGGTRHADRFFHFSDEIEISGGIKDIDLAVLPFNRDQGRLD